MTPGIKVELREFKATDYAERLPKALGADHEPLDVVGVQVPTMTNAVKDRLLPVATWDNFSEDWQEKLGETAVGQAEKAAKDGKLYSVPMGSSGGTVMYYNAALLSGSGRPSPRRSPTSSPSSRRRRSSRISSRSSSPVNRGSRRSCCSPSRVRPARNCPMTCSPVRRSGTAPRWSRR